MGYDIMSLEGLVEEQKEKLAKLEGELHDADRCYLELDVEKNLLKARAEKAEALVSEYGTKYKNAKRRADEAESDIQNYRETFAIIPHCLECQRWAINTKLEHAPDCIKAELDNQEKGNG